MVSGARVAILCEDLYEDLELWYPTYRFREWGAHVLLVGAGKQQCASKRGYPAKIDADMQAIDAGELDGVFVPGGYAPDRLRTYEPMLQLVAAMDKAGKYVGAICHGAWVLVSAQVATGRTLTCWPSLRDDVANAGGNYVDQEVVVDANLVTSRQPDDLPAFMRESLRVLAAQAARKTGRRRAAG